ncbi:MAG: protein kinase, partial [Acidobacteriota bacterium]|nr:protein kinase [Acidobacteriota bacterium]
MVEYKEGESHLSIHKPSLRREVYVLAKLRHPALPRVFDTFSEGDAEFIVMEFLPGEHLASMLSQRGSAFPVEQVLGWADELLDALEYLHKNLVVHRDIKPHNIKFTEEGGICLLGWELLGEGAGQDARVEHNSGTITIFQATSGSYAPLEHYEHTNSDARSDIYSLGATLYHLLTNEVPVAPTTRAKALIDGQPDPLMPADNLNREVSPEVAAVLRRAMALYRQERFSSASQMRARLNNAVRRKSQEDTSSTTPEGYAGAEGEPNSALKQHETGEEEKTRHQQSGAPTAAGEYDVFISYRRQGSAEAARALRAELRGRNLRVFLDVDELRAGHFDQALLRRIERMPNFIVLLSAQCLDRCNDERDWLRREIAHAVRTNRKIIPVMMPGFNFPEAHELPEDIRALPTHQSITYSHEFFDAMVAKIVKYLQYGTGAASVSPNIKDTRKASS